MSENGVIELEVGEKKTRVRKFETRLQFSAFSSILGELYHLSTFFEGEQADLSVQKENRDLSFTERKEAFEALASLEQMFRERSIPLYEKVAAVLSERVIGGTPLTEYSITDLTHAAGQFIAGQSLSEKEGKNSDGGRGSSSETRPPSTVPSADVGSSIPKETESVVKPSTT